jgi:integrase
MATIQKRKLSNGQHSYRVMIRTNDGLGDVSKTFPTHGEAKDWGIQQEALRRQGLYFPEQIKKKHTLGDLIDRYIELILPCKPKNARDTLRQLAWWKEKLGTCTLNHLTPDVLAKYRKELLEGTTRYGSKRTPATTNRYLAALSVVLSYGVKECGWLTSNPMLRVNKLAEPRGRDRVLSEEESVRFLDACANSSQPLLLPFILLSLTIGARRSELLNLTWDCLDLSLEF